LTAAVLMARIPRLEAFSHRLFNPTPSVAELTRSYSLRPLQGRPKMAKLQCTP
jgi:hypothetical protein